MAINWHPHSLNAIDLPIDKVKELQEQTLAHSRAVQAFSDPAGVSPEVFQVAVARARVATRLIHGLPLEHGQEDMGLDETNGLVLLISVMGLGFLALKHPKCPESILMDVALSGDTEFVSKVLENPACPEHVKVAASLRNDSANLNDCLHCKP